MRLDEAVPRWAPRLLLGTAVLLIPWSIWPLVSLPQSHLSHRWGLAWTGFDVALAATLIATAFGIQRQPELVAAAAPVAATLLVCDAWFDTTMSGDGAQFTIALVLALGAELPLAALCVWLARRVRVA